MNTVSKDLLFMLPLPGNLSFLINLLLSAQNTNRGDRTAGNRFISGGLKTPVREERGKWR
jgi:hypothetical protein